MIEATVLYSGSRIKGIHILNHGDPIICAAVSALSQNCANSIESFTDALFTVDCSEGDLSIQLESFDEKGIAEILLSSLLLGLENISQGYPGNINITKKKIEKEV
ncbi:MAG: ribosomal-processing cysteine protease Prp [Firmicutes bacterium]|nr:ribosomal-processing cysteine protease Prp [Bacillota bacterium]